MKYLLDVSALVAFGVLQHEFHVRTSSWVRNLASAEQPELLTCSITELGFVRVLSQTARYGLTCAQGQALLLRVKSEGEIRFSLIPDDHDITHLPIWVKYSWSNHRRPFVRTRQSQWCPPRHLGHPNPGRLPHSSRGMNLCQGAFPWPCLLCLRLSGWRGGCYSGCYGGPRYFPARNNSGGAVGTLEAPARSPA